MKKIFLSILIAIAVLLPTIAVEAADVPSFYKIGGSHFYLTINDRSGTEKGYRYYGYECEVDLNENFAEKFIETLVNDYNFRLIAHYVNDYRDYQLSLSDTWIFIYTGTKKIPLFDTKNYEDMQIYKGNLVISRKKNWEDESTRFYITIAKGLTYEED